VTGGPFRKIAKRKRAEGNTESAQVVSRRGRIEKGRDSLVKEKIAEEKKLCRYRQARKGRDQKEKRKWGRCLKKFEKQSERADKGD